VHCSLALVQAFTQSGPSERRHSWSRSDAAVVVCLWARAVYHARTRLELAVSLGNGDVMIKTCPLCGYSLYGLPEKHTCPECSFRYDRSACVVRRPLTGVVIFGTGSALMLLAGLVLWWWGGWGLGPALSASVGLMGTVSSTSRIMRGWPFVLVSREEVRVFARRDEERTVAMNAIGDVVWSRVDGSLVFKGHDDEVLLAIPAALIGSHRETQRLASLVRDGVVEQSALSR